MATINLWIHRSLDCPDFPEGANIKVKQKMQTSKVHKVTCPRCRQGLVQELIDRYWSSLSTAEIESWT